MKRLLTILAVMMACMTLSLTFTACGSDDNDDIDPAAAWICNTWSAHLYITKYENDKATSNNEETINNIKFNKDGTLTGFLDYDHWTLKGTSLTLINSKNKDASKTFTISTDQDHFTFSFTYQQEPSISNGIRYYAIIVYSFRRTSLQ